MSDEDGQTFICPCLVDLIAQLQHHIGVHLGRKLLCKVTTDQPQYNHLHSASRDTPAITLEPRRARSKGTVSQTCGVLLQVGQ